MAISKTATLILIIHTLTSSIAFATLATFDRLATEPSTLPGYLQHGPLHLLLTCTTFFLTSIPRCCCSKNTRITFKRHFITAFLLAPLLARILCGTMGWVDSAARDSEVRWTAACFDQIDLGDPDVVLRTAFCEHRYSISKSVVEKKIGGRRKRFDFVEDLTKACIDLKEVRMNDGGWTWCWVGMQQGVKSNEEFFKKNLEECYAQFGLEAVLTLKGQSAVVEIKFPFINKSSLVSNTTIVQFEVDIYGRSRPKVV